MKVAPKTTHLIVPKSPEANYLVFLMIIAKYNPEFVISEMEQRLEKYKKDKEFKNVDACIPQVRVFSVLAKINPDKTKQLINSYEQLFSEMMEFTEKLFETKDGIRHEDLYLFTKEFKKIQMSALWRSFGIAYLYLGEKEKVREIAQKLNCDPRVFDEIEKDQSSKIIIENVLSEEKWEMALVQEFIESNQLGKAWETLKIEMNSPVLKPGHFYKTVLKIIEKCSDEQKASLVEEIVLCLETNEILNSYFNASLVEIYLKIGKIDEAKRIINEKATDEYCKVKSLILLAKYSQDKNEVLALLDEAEENSWPCLYTIDLIKIAEIYSSVDKNKAIQILSQQSIAKFKDDKSYSSLPLYRKEYKAWMRVWMKINPEYLLDLFKQKKIDCRVLYHL